MSEHRSFPDATDGRPMPPMGYTLLEGSAGLLDWDGAAEVARRLRADGYYLVRAEDIQWSDIRRFQGELNRGQGVYEDAGGFLVRCIMALFGKRHDPVETYQEAADRLLKEADLAD